MKSIQTKFILLVVVAIVLTELLTSAIGSYSYSCAMEEDADRILQLAAEEKMQELNGVSKTCTQNGQELEFTGLQKTKSIMLDTMHLWVLHFV